MSDAHHRATLLRLAAAIGHGPYPDGSAEACERGAEALREMVATDRPYLLRIIDESAKALDVAKAQAAKMREERDEAQAEVQAAWDCWGDEEKDTFPSLAEAIMEVLGERDMAAATSLDCQRELDKSLQGPPVAVPADCPRCDGAEGAECGPWCAEEAA